MSSTKSNDSKGGKDRPGTTEGADGAADIFTEMLRIQGEAARQVMQAFVPQAVDAMPGEQEIDALGASIMEFQESWFGLNSRPDGKGGKMVAPFMADPAQWMALIKGWQAQIPAADPQRQVQLWEECAQLWQQILSQYSPDAAGDPAAALPRKDRRFDDPAWREQPVFALIHQTYLLLAERISESVDEIAGIDDAEREELRFATRSVIDAMSPANFAMMNPVVLERTIETEGENLVMGMERLTRDLEKGQLTHTDTSGFVLGENVAATPGKVIYETKLFQLIQYSPATAEVMETPLVIFPPWINRFYILDLNPRKSFVKWAVDQGLTVLMVSWKSADESFADVEWDDYIRAQIEAIDVTRDRLGVKSVHTIGYCVAGTTLAATLAILARRKEADKVASATFFTAQVDFERAGELRLFVDDRKLDMVRQASQGGYLDGRYMAAVFNMLRGPDLIWNYVVNHYLLGKEYPAFDLLFWNGDVTNLPAKWHQAYLRDLYRDNLLVQPDAMSADGTPIDLRMVKTPAYIQAGREDHIAPPESVFRSLEHFSGPVRFLLAGSGHIAGVVNPPAANKYQYWTGPSGCETLDEFIEQAEEHPGSWWTDWIAWIEGLSAKRIKATGKRKPGGKSNPAIEDAPGRYVKMR